MPNEALGKIMAATETADVATLATIEALRSISDTMRAMQSEIKEIAKETRDVRERVIRMESSSSDKDIQQNRTRIEALEKDMAALKADKQRRDGALDLSSWFVRSWPNLVGFLVMLAALLVATGKVPL